MWVQLPRLYNVYKEQGIIENFEQLLDNIFHPLFEVTRDPNSHPQLHLFLKNVSSAVLLLKCLWQCMEPCLWGHCGLGMLMEPILGCCNEFCIHGLACFERASAGCFLGQLCYH